MASTSASSVRKSFKYDVFLSFRGEDTRKSFVDHLYKALDDKGIITYKDDEKIQKGERISEQLLRSIEESRFHIVVFSKNYASSSWCLDELVKIMECQKMKEHTAYPIFYDVEPTEVRNQSGAVGEAFAKHEKGFVLPLDRLCCIVASCCKGSSSSLDKDLENEDDVGRWRNAMKEAANLAGMELKNTFNGHEAKFIQQIVQDIALKLRFVDFTVDEKLVGMETRVESIISSLEIGSEDVRMIGIKGIGGGGKTTLARAVFDHISIWFEGKSFVENVREGSKGSGLKELQKQILSTVLNDKSIDVTSVSDGKDMMKMRMPRSIKVLIVLDDVDNIEQLEALAGELTWFLPGSRIIITTRDEQVLVAHGVHSDYIHDACLLSNEEAICLFRRYAFKRGVPDQGYENLSRKVIHYAAGLPLTIKVLGSFLHGRIELEWVDAIERLKTIPLKETLEKLELSYNGLENDHKEIFLDVVCFLKGEKKKRAIRILEGYGFKAQIGLRVLEQKSLITISDIEGLRFHDHIEEMGMNIVRRLHPDQPNRHSRLWITEEIKDILVNDLGTEEIRGISLQGRDLHPIQIMKGIRKMRKLRCLIVYSLNGYGAWKVDEDDKDMDISQDALRFVYWYQYPFCWLPKLFQPNELVNLVMIGSNICELWEGGEKKVLKNLRFLDLSKSKLRTFDLGLTPHLQELNLQECYHFVELHLPFKCSKLKSINLGSTKVRYLNLGMTPHLEWLNLQNCYSLQEIHAPVGCLKNLYNLELNSCLEIYVDSEYGDGATLRLTAESLDKCPLHSKYNLPNLQFKCMYRERLPSSSGNLEKLISFGLCACTNLESFLANICGLQHLKRLDLYDCPLVEKLPEELGRLECLEVLDLPYCISLRDIPTSICNLKCLKRLDLRYCILLEKLPEELGLLDNLEELNLSGCKSLRDIPTSICNMKCLKHLDLYDCILVEKLPEELGRLECLEVLDLPYCKSLRDIPTSICNMKCLKRLDLRYCILVEKLPEEVGRLECLEELNLSGCKSLQYIPDNICKMICLIRIYLSDCILIERLPEELGHLKCLEYLNLASCKYLLDIPNSISNMKCLKSLNLSGCILVDKLPREFGRLESLKELFIHGTGIRGLPQNVYQLKGLRIYGSREQLESNGFTSLTKGYEDYCYIEL